MRLSKAFTAVIVLFLLAGTGHPSAQSGGTGRFVTAEILVKFRPGANAAAKADAHRGARGAQIMEIERTRVQRVRVAAGDEADAINRYRRNPNVEYAEPNYIRRLPMPIAHGSESPIVPGDIHFQEQWALHNTGQAFYCIPFLGSEWCLYSGTTDADIDAPEAWAISTGNSTVTVAVIDSGVDYMHPDLAPNYAGGDDFVFLDGDPMDDHGHGTHVAGTIAAALDNPTGVPAEAEGVTGVAPNARILAYKVCRADGTCDDFAIQQAVARAVDDGAKVINMSLGETAFSQSLNEAVQAAWNAGVVIVAGAGNDGTTTRFYPAAFDNVISVAAFDEDHRRPSFSNYGDWVDLSAPGNAIMSTYPMAACETSTTPGDTGCYTWNTGTSMATPHVAGAAALVWTRSDVVSNSQVVDILLSSADGRGASNVRLDTWTIHGGLNLHDAMSYGLTNLPPDANAGPDQTVTDSDRDGAELVTLDGSASSDIDGSITSYVWREASTSIASGETPEVWLSLGVHTLTLEVTDDAGDTAIDSVVVTVNPANQVTVTASTLQAAEAGATAGVFTVARTGDTTLPLTVRYTVGGTALADSDYLTLPGSVTIQAGSSTAAVIVTPIDDVMSESDESVILTVSADAAYGLGSPIVATVTIVSDDLPPDLVVSATAATPASAGADTDIVVTDTTKNQGSGTAVSSKTGFYLSSNLVLDASDVWLGDRLVPSLGPGVTHAVATTVRIPPSTAPGSYRILTKADWDTAVNESDEGNNTKASGLIKIGPDLIASALTAPAAVAAGGSIGVSDTTANQGGGTAGASTTRFYWSTNTSLDASDQVIGARAVGLLAAGESASSNTMLTVPATAGTYYVIAQADGGGQVPETTETNNTRASAAIKVGPDLIVTAVSVPSSGAAGGTISANETTKNQGAGPATASSTAFYLSPNGTISADDRLIGSRSVGELASNGTSTESTVLQIPADIVPGSYYVIARTDWNGSVAEATESNNDKSSGAIIIGGDLTVTAVSASNTAKAGGLVTVSDTTKNQGATAVAESMTAFYLSTNTVYDATDQFLGNRLVGALAASASNTATTPLVIPPGTAAGAYYVIAVADANGTVAESLENNNTRNSADIRIGPDLTVTGLTAPTSAVAGTSITVSDTTMNQGADTAPASFTKFYLSSNLSLDSSDPLLGFRAVGSLEPGLSEAAPIVLPIPATTAGGTYYIIAKSDGDNAIAESRETNNTRPKSISIAPASSP